MKFSHILRFTFAFVCKFSSLSKIGLKRFFRYIYLLATFRPWLGTSSAYNELKKDNVTTYLHTYLQIFFIYLIQGYEHKNVKSRIKMGTYLKDTTTVLNKYFFFVHSKMTQTLQKFWGWQELNKFLCKIFTLLYTFKWHLASKTIIYVLLGILNYYYNSSFCSHKYHY